MILTCLVSTCCRKQSDWLKNSWKFVKAWLTSKYVPTNFWIFIPFFIGVRLYHYQNGQSYLQNYEQFYTRLSQDNSNKKIKWEKLYDFKTVYNVPDLSPNSLLQIYNTIWTKDDLGWLIYLKMYKFNTLNKINGMYHGN